MKRTCLHKNTTCPNMYPGNTDSLSRNCGKQIACEFHPVEHFIKIDKLEPAVNQ